MNLLEEAVLEYLTHDGDVFLCPQYRARGGNPDFVALNFTKHQIEVVEVSGAYNLKRLVSKVKEGDWVQEVVQQLKKKRVIDDNWKPVLRVFVAAAYKEEFCKKIGSPSGVIVETIDDVFACLLDWRKRREPRPCDAEE
jgi:Holliday junction resolvase-like predicted endonuclease